METPPQMVPQIEQHRLNTTPDLFPNAQLQIERDLGTHGEAIYDLSHRVSSLESLRVDPDRKDIDGLKATRSHFIWTFSLISSVIALLIVVFGGLYKRFGKIIWAENVDPRIRNYLKTLIERT